MRDKQFVAVHRGGELSKENHSRLMHWGRLCALRGLSLLKDSIDARLEHALVVAEAWEKGETSVGEAQRASVAAHAAARESSDPVSTAVARAIGHAVATAHMADHSLGGALYVLKAIKLAGGAIDQEKKWQMEQLQSMGLPSELVTLIQKNLTVKEKALIK
ncbi:MAG: hypothetical protein CL609_11215 [Anaerolineaceae bacterium]|nr:hypothetical protein [Anaerolineaceae bacterium]